MDAEGRGPGSESPWESARLAAVTFLTIVVFGLGWVSLELKGASDASGYDVLARGPGGISAMAGSDLTSEQMDE